MRNAGARQIILLMRRLLGFIVVLAGLAMAVSVAEAHTLSYGVAKRVAQHRADQFAGQHTNVDTLFQLSRHSYYAQATWNQVDPTGCKDCGYDPNTGQFIDTPTTEYCFVELKVKFRSARSRKVKAAVTGSACF